MPKRAYIKLQSGTVIETANPELWPEGERMTAKAGADALLAESLRSLRKSLKPGDTVYTVLRHRSRSGMFRRIDLYKLHKGEPQYLSGHAARVLGYRMSDKAGQEGIPVGGCGMDMGFHLVYNLSRALFGPDYYTGRPRKGTKAARVAEAAKTDAGYALNHRWL